MSKVCVNCGREIKDGNLCVCTERTAFFQFDSKQAINLDDHNSIDIPASESFGDFFQNALNEGFKFIKNPLDYLTQKNGAMDFKIGLLYLGFLSIIVALFSAFKLTTLYENSIFSIFEEKATSIMTMGGFESKFGMDFLITRFGMSLLWFFLQTGIFIGIIKLLTKNQKLFLSTLGALGMSSIPLSIILLLTLILFFIPISVIKLLIFICILFYIQLFIIEFKASIKISEKWSLYVIILLMTCYMFSVLHLCLGVI